MGYHSINKGWLERSYDDNRRIIVAKVYCDELQREFYREFLHEELNLALGWIMSKMSELSM